MSTEMIKRLTEERLRTWEEGKALIESADEAKRSLDGEEEVKWDAINTSLDDLDKRIQALYESEKREQRAAELRSDVDKLIRPTAEPEIDKRDDGAVLAAEIRDMLKGERREVEITPGKGSRPFNELRALGEGSSGAGGATVPTTFYNQLLVYMIQMSAIMSAGAPVFETDAGENIDFPKVTGLSSSTQTAEATTIATSNPTFGKLTLGAYKYPVLVDISRELLDDTGVDLLSFIAQEAGWAIGNAFGSKLVTGAGSTEPSGIVTGASAGITGGTGQVGVPTADELIALFYSVIAPYRARPAAGWLMNDSTVGKIRRIKDTTNQYIWQRGLVGNATDTILGKPVFTDPNMAATALNAKSVVFGDISRYYVRKVKGIRFERSDDVQFKEDIVTFKAVIRGDGGVADTSGALKTYVGGAS